MHTEEYMVKPKPKKPAKPRRDFPLFYHASGQWAKKIRGRTIYFGVDAQEAEKRYDLEKDALLAGKPVDRSISRGITLAEMCNHYLTAKRDLVDSGERSPYTFSDACRICESMTTFFGRDQVVADLKPEDFGRFRAKLAKNVGMVALTNAVVRARTAFNWAFENGKLLAPASFGTSFDIPGRKVERRERNEARRQGQVRMFTPEELRRILEAARQPLRSMVLLSLNAGLGNSDISSLPISALDLDKGWLDFPRVKTETDRRCPLWPETIAAIREWLAQRPEPADAKDADLVFLTRAGNRWIQQGNVAGKEGLTYRNDNVAKEFDIMLRKVNMKRHGSFYNLRHCHRTAAANSLDAQACDAIMGHVDNSMSAFYVHAVADDRLRAVTDCVHRWLFPDPTPAADPTILKFQPAAFG
jgi:integrase